MNILQIISLSKKDYEKEFYYWCSMYDDTKHIKDYLGEIPLPKDEKNFEDSYWSQTDNMFHTDHNIVYCNMCSQDHYKKESEK